MTFFSWGGSKGVDLVLELRGASGGWIFAPKNSPIFTKIQILAYFRPKTHLISLKHLCVIHNNIMIPYNYWNVVNLYLKQHFNSFITQWFDCLLVVEN